MRYLLLVITHLASCLLGEKYFQQNVDYEIEVSLNDSDRTLSAFEKIHYKNNSPDTLNYIWFHIWPNAYKNDSTALAKQFKRLGSTRFQYTKEKDRGYIDSLDFFVNDVKASWDLHPEHIDIAKISLENSLAPGQSLRIETPFFVKLPRVASRLGHSGDHYEITQWYPKPAVYDKEGWHPMPYLNMGEFYSEFGTFDVKITLPEHYRIMATGDIINGQRELDWLDSLASIGDSISKLSEKERKKHFKEKINSEKESAKINTTKNKPNTKTIQFRQKNVHDFAWFADPNYIVQKGQLWLDDSSKSITLWSMYLPTNAKLWSNSIEYLHDSGLWYSRFYGNYPYNHITAVDGDMSAGGGMEYPNITVISKSGSKDLLEYVIMHEVGHNWFYGILGSNERDHAWMDEGLTEYSGTRYWEKKYSSRNSQFVFIDGIQKKIGIGKNYNMQHYQYSNYASSALKDGAQPLNISSDENYSFRNYGQNYSKVAVMMRYFQHYLGEDKMDVILQDYFESWKFKHPKPNDLIAFFNKHLDEDVGWFFDNMVDSTTYIDYAAHKKNGEFIIKNNGNFDVPIEVAFYDKRNKEIGREWLSFEGNSHLLKTPIECKKIIIDPDQHMPDVKRTNNSTRRPLETHFIYDKPSYNNTDINIIPWLPTYNSYDGNLNGLLFSYGGGAGFGGESLNAFVLYGDKKKKINGIIRAKKEFYNLGFLSLGIFESTFESRGGREGVKFSFTAKKNKRSRTNFKQNIMKISFNYHNIKSITALNPDIYNIGKFGTVKLRLGKYWEPSFLSSYEIFSKIHAGKNFSKLDIGARVEKTFLKGLKTKIQVDAGSFLYLKNIYKQYHYYLSGSVIPDFDNYVWDRNAGNKLSVLEKVYHGGGIRGVNIADPFLSSDDNIFMVRVRQSLPKFFLPDIFFDFAAGESLPEANYTSGGIIIGPIIIPLYQSWEAEYKTPNNLNWIKERLRLSWTYLTLSF